jgi:hypothetical protein
MHEAFNNALSDVVYIEPNRGMVINGIMLAPRKTTEIFRHVI